MVRRILALVMLLLAIGLLIFGSLLVFTPSGKRALTLLVATPTPTPRPYIPIPLPTAHPIITIQDAVPNVSASAAYLVDMASGNILYNRGGETPLPMASTTKIMTALIAIQTGNLDTPITISTRAHDHAVKNGGSSAFLQVGDTLTLKALIYALMLPSGDDAAIAIAETLGGGSLERFVERMNLFAYHLRLFQTHFSNVDGLTLDEKEEHDTTAADLVRLTRYAMTVPLFVEIVQTETYTVPATEKHGAYKWSTTNKLLGTYNGMLGVKTGFTYAAGYCLVFAAQRNDHYLIGVTLNSPDDEQRWQDVRTLLDWGFAQPLLPPETELSQ